MDNVEHWIQETAVEFSPQHHQKQHATPSKQEKAPEEFTEPYTVPNIKKFKIPSSTSENKTPKKISSFDNLKQQKPLSKNEKIKPNQKSDSDVPVPFGTPIQKKRHGKNVQRKILLKLLQLRQNLNLNKNQQMPDYQLYQNNNNIVQGILKLLNSQNYHSYNKLLD
jgi:hypothetical protein